MPNTELAVRPLTVIEIEVSSGLDDHVDSPYRGRTDPTIILSSTVKPSKRQIHYTHLGFPFAWERFVFERDGKYKWHCWLLPFMLVQAKILPFHLVMDNLGDGQIGMYLKIARNMPPYRMVVSQEGKRDLEIEEYVFESQRYCAAHVNELQTVRIEEIAQEASQA